MASRFMRLFYNPEKLAEANAKYKARIAEINANDAEVKDAIATARAANKATLKTQLALNNAEFERNWNRA